MNIQKMIDELQKIQKEYGDIEVRVQYQDGGGYYEGSSPALVMVTTDDDSRKEAEVNENVALIY